MSQMDRNSAYAAAEGREFLRDELAGKTNEFVREFAGLIDDRETLDLLNYYCSLWEDKGESFLDTRMGQIIVKSAATETMDDAFRAGNTSQLKGMVGLTTQERDADEAVWEVARRLSNEGCIAFVVGPPGSGKTAFLADVMRVWGAITGGAIFTNLDWSGADAQIETDRQMFREMAHTEGATLAGLDELSKELTGYGSDAKKAEEFVSACTQVRKKEDKHGPYAKQGSIAGVGHTKKRLAASLRRMATLIVQKPTPDDPGKVVLYESEGGADELDETGEFKGATDTREDYDQHNSEDFDVVGDEDDEDDEDSGPSAEEIAKRKDIETAIRLVLDGHTQKEAAQPTDFGRGWVGDRWREWKNGKHRELVPVPETLPDNVAEEDKKNG
jgi:hypothetical protein